MRLLRRRHTETVPAPAEDLYLLGTPMTCPICGGDGYLDRINVSNETQTQHCKRCEFKWATDAHGEVVADA